MPKVTNKQYEKIMEELAKYADNKSINMAIDLLEEFAMRGDLEIKGRW